MTTQAVTRRRRILGPAYVMAGLALIILGVAIGLQGDNGRPVSRIEHVLCDNPVVCR